MRHLLCLTAATLAAGLGLAAAGCGDVSAGSQRASGGSGSTLLPDTVPSEVLGVLNGEELTLDDLTERDRVQLAKLRIDYYTGVHALLEESAERAAREQLLLNAAQEQGLTLNQFYLREIGVPEVSDQELQMVYDSNRQALGGRPLAEVAADLRRQIGNQKMQRKIAAEGNRMLGEAAWELLVPAFRIDIETAGHAALGPDDAPIEMIVFSDFECPYCRRFNDSLDQLREEYSDEVRVVFRHLPLRSIHPLAQKAAEASICAGDQGKFWEYHDALWTDSDLGADVLEQHGRLLGLDTEAFAECLNSGRHYQRVQDDYETALNLGLTGTPAVFVNGRHIGGYVAFPALKNQVERELDAVASSN